MRNLTIALDIMGGDHGPLTILAASLLAIEKYPQYNFSLFGDEKIIEPFLQEHEKLDAPNVSIVHAPEQVMMDERPASAMRSKRHSSMKYALDAVHNEEADACVSAGNTGALLGMALFTLKTLPGIVRPALISSLPTLDESQHVHVLDLGANVVCDSETLFQFAVMGSVMAETVEHIEKPKVALLNMGVEEIKGNDQIKQTAQLLSSCKELNYVGFIEGNDIFSGKADVIVCEGFVGNVALKTSEGIAKLILKKLKTTLNRNFFTKFLGSILLPAFKTLYARMNPDQYNGASLIGLRGTVVKSHGNASENAFLTAIERAIQEAENKLPEQIKTKIEAVLFNRV